MFICWAVSIPRGVGRACEFRAQGIFSHRPARKRALRGVFRQACAVFVEWVTLVKILGMSCARQPDKRFGLSGSNYNYVIAAGGGCLGLTRLQFQRFAPGSGVFGLKTRSAHGRSGSGAKGGQRVLQEAGVSPCTLCHCAPGPATGALLAAWTIRC